MNLPAVRERAVMIWWDDSSGIDEAWQSVERARESQPTLCASLGLVVREDTHSITIIQSVAFTRDFEMDSVGNPLTIPRSAIVAIRRVKLPAPSRRKL